MSPPNSYLRKKQINNNNNNNITTSLNEINKILNNNNGALIVDEIPITIQFDTSTKQQTNVDAAAASLNNYKKPIAIQNQFLKMHMMLERETKPKLYTVQRKANVERCWRCSHHGPRLAIMAL